MHKNIAGDFTHDQRNERHRYREEDFHSVELQVLWQLLNQSSTNIGSTHERNKVEEKHGSEKVRVIGVTRRTPHGTPTLQGNTLSKPFNAHYS
jgi:hypothetical protein